MCPIYSGVLVSPAASSTDSNRSSPSSMGGWAELSTGHTVGVVHKFGVDAPEPCRIVDDLWHGVGDIPAKRALDQLSHLRLRW